MARIAGVDLPNDKRIEIALTYIFGIGTTSAKDIIRETGINPDTRVKDLSEDEVAKIRDQIENNLRERLAPTSRDLPISVAIVDAVTDLDSP